MSLTQLNKLVANGVEFIKLQWSGIVPVAPEDKLMEMGQLLGYYSHALPDLPQELRDELRDLYRSFFSLARIAYPPEPTPEINDPEVARAQALLLMRELEEDENWLN